MFTEKYRRFIEQILSEADVEINGQRPWDIRVHDERFYGRAIKQHSLGIGESYMDSWWDCDQLDVFYDRCLTADIPEKIHKNWRLLLRNIIYILFNIQTRERSVEVAEKHYNLDNELYELMLGESMAYTCAYWKNAENLDQAQYQKYDLICRKLSINENDNVLELGCGWGGFAKYAATHYGCKVSGINISSEQVRYAKARSTGLPIQFFLTDYRDAHLYNSDNKQFDKIVSIGLCEHIGYKNYPKFMQLAYQQLKPNGLFLLHTIGNNFSVVNTEPWTSKYIFPNGMIPSIKQLGGAMEKLFVMEDWHNIGPDYDKTLMAWHDNFQKHWPNIAHKYDQRFYRMWVYYLLSCAGLFRSRRGQLWQIVLSKDGVRGGYQSVR